MTGFNFDLSLLCGSLLPASGMISYKLKNCFPVQTGKFDSKVWKTLIANLLWWALKCKVDQNRWVPIHYVMLDRGERTQLTGFSQWAENAKKYGKLIMNRTCNHKRSCYALGRRLHWGVTHIQDQKWMRPMRHISLPSRNHVRSCQSWIRRNAMMTKPCPASI